MELVIAVAIAGVFIALAVAFVRHPVRDHNGEIVEIPPRADRTPDWDWPARPFDYDKEG
jgi:hypothetical protein